MHCAALAYIGLRTGVSVQPLVCTIKLIAIRIWRKQSVRYQTS
jgi:hypothetical protein